MKARLFCPTAELPEKEFFIESEATIGRGRANEIVLPSEVVSGRHARLYYSEREKAFWIEDLGSRNGTRVDGRRLVRPRKLGDLHIVTLALGLDFVFQLVPDSFVSAKSKRPEEPLAVDKTFVKASIPVLPQELASEEGREASLQPHPEKEPTILRERPIVAPDFAAPSKTPPPPVQPEEETSRYSAPLIGPPGLDRQAEKAAPSRPGTPQGRPAKPVRPAGPATPQPEGSGSYSGFILMAVGEDGTANTFRLSPGENLIGRHEKCAIRIQHPTVSRKHAVLTVQGERALLSDLGGPNPTLLEGEKVEGEVELAPHQEIHIGQVKAVLVSRSRKS